MEEIISQATKNNWKKLKTDSENKLTSRANKRLSMKKIIPLEYIKNKENLNKIVELLEFIKENKWLNEDIIYSLAINLIKIFDIEKQKNVKKFLKEYSYLNKIEELLDYNIKDIKENDFLGLIYQCLMYEGEKNKKGSYYTPQKVTNNMTNDLDFSGSQTFLDPCCGSGAFLLSLNISNPKNIYGTDTDGIAVMIAKINLIIKYRGTEFTPKIFKCNFLETESLDNTNKILNKKFTYIVTNPPWGAVTEKKYIPKEITSKEIFSCFIVRGMEKLKRNGKLRFLLPISVLNVKVHKDVREYILNNGNLNKITLYDDSFTGVTTKYIDLEIEKRKSTEDVIIQKGNEMQIQKKDYFDLSKNKVFAVIDSQSKNILEKIKENGKYYLDNSIWALGIVTGDNKKKLANKPIDGYEAIYTGKDINQYKLEKPKKYLKYNRDELQQVAKEEYYRAPEKLVYKFISNKLVFAYDNKKSLFLNSANILIPNIPNMSIKTTMAYLNSELFSYYYKNIFGEIKILKGNLMEIPFPNITKEQDERISTIVDEIMNEEANDELLQEEIYRTYRLDENEIRYIKKGLFVNGDII